MKAISLWQPWASAIALGIKKIETRSWSTNYRGPLLIHAAKTFPKSARDFAAEELACGRGIDRVPLGAFVAIAKLAAVEPAEDVNLSISAIERRYGDYSIGRFAWRLENVRRFLEPVGYSGRQGLFEVPRSVIENELPIVCRVCGGEVLTYYEAHRDQAVCPEHCPDHQYEYDRGDRKHYCKTCGQEPPPDFYDHD